MLARLLELCRGRSRYDLSTPLLAVCADAKTRICVQSRVTNAYGVGRFFPHDPAAGTIFEWTFSGVTFDGLVPFTCHLLEAKYGHGSWFADDFSTGGRPSIRDSFVEAVLMPKIYDECLRHYTVVKPHHPDVTLTWVFSDLVFKIFMMEWFLGPLTPGDMSVIVETRHLS